jgi:hypothetical protein
MDKWKGKEKIALVVKKIGFEEAEEADNLYWAATGYSGY